MACLCIKHWCVQILTLLAAFYFYTKMLTNTFVVNGLKPIDGDSPSSPCSITELTCVSGQCVPITSRCLEQHHKFLDRRRRPLVQGKKAADQQRKMDHAFSLPLLPLWVHWQHDAFNQRWNIRAILDQSESFKLLIDLEHYQEVDLCGFCWIWALSMTEIKIIGGSWRKKAAAGGGHWSREMRPRVSSFDYLQSIL